MATLTEEVKVFIVQALACFDSPSQVVQAVKDQFGLALDRRQVESYDPTKVASKGLAKRLRELFDATRKAFLESAAAVPVAQQAYRLRVLQRLIERAESRGNAALVAQLLEQAAKEIGGAFTNRRELTGKGGGPVQAVNLTTDEFRRIAAEVAAKV